MIAVVPPPCERRRVLDAVTQVQLGLLNPETAAVRLEHAVNLGQLPGRYTDALLLRDQSASPPGIGGQERRSQHGDEKNPHVTPVLREGRHALEPFSAPEQQQHDHGHEDQVEHRHDSGNDTFPRVAQSLPFFRRHNEGWVGRGHGILVVDVPHAHAADTACQRVNTIRRPVHRA